jgi:hypothetical protein
MNHDQDKASAKESAKKVDARDANMTRSDSAQPKAPQKHNQTQGAHADQNKPPSDRAVRGFDAPDHEVKEDLHRSVRKD